MPGRQPDAARIPMTDVDLSPSVILKLLTQGTVVSQGLLPWSSNYTFLVQVCGVDREVLAVYKPQRGERPLWDFAGGTLCLRERAAFLVSEGLSWGLVPPTVLREGPHGLGSLQWFVPHEAEAHYFTLEGQFPDQVQRIALFDVICNNADRKAGHVLLGEDDRLWAIDQGICFHAEYKLRTVIWEFAGEPVPAPLMADIEAFRARLADPAGPLPAALAALLSPREVAAISTRLQGLLRAGTFPRPGPGRHYPWPLV